MPKFENADVRARIADGSVTAVSIDTAIFDRYGCNLEHAVLARLDQFKKGGVNLVFSEVVVKEVRAHIAVAAGETKRELTAALKRHDRRWRLAKDLDALKKELQLDIDPTAAAVEQLDQYLAAVGAEVIPGEGDGTLAAEVLRRYFEIVTPFEAREAKKHEFPDAFALLGLEQAARARNKLIVCVSPDKGWAEFAEKSQYLVVVPELDVLMSWFNDPGCHFAEKVVAVWKKDAPKSIAEEVARGFEYYLDGIGFDINADAPLNYEVEPLNAVLQHIYSDKIGAPSVIAEDENEMTMTVKVVAKIGFEAAFSFYAHDAVDGDSVALGSRVPYTEDDLTFDVTLVVAREMDGDEIEVLDTTVTSTRVVANFGYVDPFPDENPTHEKN
ncbi:PIN domain-containing protein [Bosea sp. RCC_152_1]|uniref:PIN domain-containing protein n=1 Tax=Bosea sp. RCC_152_1 TaxID=3239228 RepID=UPI003524F21E